MLAKFGERALYLSVVVFVIMSSLLGVALWQSLPAVVEAQTPPPPVATPTPIPPIAATVGIIAPRSADGDMGMKMGYDWAASKGLKVVAEQWYPPGTNDFTPFLVSLLSANPGNIYIGGSSEKDSYVIQDVLKKLGFAGKVVVGPAPVPLRAPQTTHVNMGWKEAGPVFGPGQAPPGPAVAQLAPQSFVMWYYTGGAVSWATSSDGTKWTDQGPISVSGALPTGYMFGMPPNVVFWREKVGVVWQEHFLMYVPAFFVAGPPGPSRHYDYILVLQSSDGANWSYIGTAFADDTPGVDPPGNLNSLAVIKGASGYEGWLNQGNAIYRAASSDGLVWSAPQATTGLPTPVLLASSVVRLAGKYVMWYGYGVSPEPPTTAIGMALSDDGVSWVPSPENPLFKVEAGTWRSELVFAPWVVLDEANGLWRMWFTGGSSHLQENTEFLTLDAASPTDSPAPGRFARGVGDPAKIVAQLRSPFPVQPLVSVNSAKDDDGNSYTVASYEAGGKVTVAGWATLDGGAKPASAETLTVKYSQHIPDYAVGYAQAPTHILNDVAQRASWGDEIIVHPGVYLGQVCADEAIRLISSHGPALTLVDARQELNYKTPNGEFPAIWVGADEGRWSELPDWWWQRFGVPETRIEGFTVSNSQGIGALLRLLPGDKASLNPKGRIVNNVACKVSGAGIGMACSVNDARAENNLTYGNGVGIAVNASGWVGLFNNSVHDNTQDGIFLTARSGGWSYAHVQDNAVNNNGGSGIRLATDDGYLFQNTITGNVGDGIRVERNFAEVLENTIQNSGKHGVALVGKDGSRIVGNTITGSGNDGIYSTTNNNLISANQITGNKQGIWLEGDNNRILGNTIQNNVSAAPSGIHLTASAEGNQIHYNNIVGNSPRGVFKETAPAVDAANNWWGQASGPSGSGPGTGDSVNENVGFTPWLSAAFSDTTPPTVAEAVALPRSVALYALADSTSGPIITKVVINSADEQSGVLNGEMNLKPLAEMLASDLQIPPERVAEWQSWLQSLEHYRWIWDDRGAPPLLSGDLDLRWLANDIANRFSKWGMGEMAQVLPFKLHAGEAQVPVTVYDGAGNHVVANIPLTIVDAMLPLNAGWNLRSLPISLNDDVWGHIKALGDGLSSDVALRFNDSTQQWQALGDTDRWRPLDGIYLHATEQDQVNLVIGRSPTAPPLRDLAAGWALVGPAPAVGTSGLAVTDALRSLEVNASGQRGYLIATSPPQLASYRQAYRYHLPDDTWRSYGSYDWHFEQQPWAYLSGDTWQGQNMGSAGGYWVYLEHADSLAGLSSTPVVSSILPQTSGLKPAQAPASGPPPLPMVILVSDGASWSQIAAKVGGQVVGQIQASDPSRLLLVQGDLPTGAEVDLYVDGVIAGQAIAYESGKIVSFSAQPVLATIQATVVSLQGGSRPATGRVVPVTLRLFAAGATNDNLLNGTGILATFTTSTVDTGTNNVAFQVAGVAPGTYDITIVSAHTLTNVKKNVTLNAGSNSVGFGTLLEGNSNNDGIVNAIDFSILAASYLKSTGQASFDARADYDINGIVNSLDFSLLAANYLKYSPIAVP